MARLKTALQVASKRARRPVTVVQPSNGRFTVGGNDHLYEASRIDPYRTRPRDVDLDTHETLSIEGRRNLLNAGRSIAASYPVIEGAILEQAAMAAESILPQYVGSTPRWGARAEEWLREWEQDLDVAGGALDATNLRELIVIETLIDGDIGFVLTEMDGLPAIQTIRSHRIGRNGIEQLPSGNANEIDGVIVDAQRRPLRYIIGIDETGEEITEIPAENFILAYQPTRADQLRGISRLGSAIRDLEDTKESRDFELLAQKACAANALVEHNELGESDPARETILNAASYDETKRTVPKVVKLEGGTYNYFRAGSGAKLEPFRYDRPGSNSREFQREVILYCFRALEWDFLFSVDPTRLSGASMRVVVDKIKRTVRKRQRLVIKTMRRIHAYAIAKAMASGALPFNVDWFRWEYQVPAELTADRKYDSDVDVQEHGAKMTTLRNMWGKRGGYWEDGIRQWMREQKRINEIADEEGVDLSTIQPATTINNRPRRAPVEEPDTEEDEEEENAS